MELSQLLWNENFNIAQESLDSKFVQGIKSGNLPKENFQAYLAQDYFFLESFAKAYGLAISKSEDKHSIKILSQLLMGVSEELVLHESYSKNWGIDLSFVTINNSTREYTNFLAKVSKEMTSIEIISSMTPCMRLYAWIGKNLSESACNNPYKDWILTYSDQSFDDLAFALENLMNNYKQPYNYGKLNSLYQKAMQLEANFFKSYSNF